MKVYEAIREDWRPFDVSRGVNYCISWSGGLFEELEDAKRAALYLCRTDRLVSYLKEEDFVIEKEGEWRVKGSYFVLPIVREREIIPKGGRP